MENQANPVKGVMETAIQGIKDMVDVNTVIGDPIRTDSGATIIPVSKVGFGFASGGSDFATKNLKDNASPCFGGGSGAAVTVTPVAFLVVDAEGHVQLLNLNQTPLGSLDKAVDMVPGIIESFRKKKTSEE